MIEVSKLLLGQIFYFCGDKHILIDTPRTPTFSNTYVAVHIFDVSENHTTAYEVCQFNGDEKVSQQKPKE